METMVILVALGLIFNFLNGFTDSSNIVATIISSRVASPRKALWTIAAAEFVGPFLFGVAVAKTIGADILPIRLVSTNVVIAALLSAILWNVITYIFGIPGSSSHAMIGGLLGAGWAGVGLEHIQIPGLVKALAGLFLSPLAGLLAGFLVTRLVYFLARGASPHVNWIFKNGQLVTGIALALSHGANDAQKTMGLIALGLVAMGVLPDFQIPLWVIACSAGAIALGTSTGGWRLIRTLGGRFYKIRPVNGFCAQIASAGVIFTAALLGGPVSTTQVVSSAILGTGAAERINKVRWALAGQIAIAWLLTIPITAVLSAGLYLGLNMLGR